MSFDGTTLTIRDVDTKKFAQANAPGTLDQLADHMRNDLGINAPGADLLLADVYSALIADVLTAKYVCLGIVGGVECEHLAFRNHDTDWQLWVRTGAEPAPCKMVITSKTMASGPQYTIDIRDWKAGVPIEDAAIAFKADAADAKVEFVDLSALDEVPPGAAVGEEK
jgi:hypothetical protein